MGLRRHEQKTGDSAMGAAAKGGITQAWAKYQREAARTFRGLGMQVKTNAVVRGVRTRHAVDVLVQGRFVGFEITWLVECKLWKSRVSKLHVLALREIVSDVGADRGILLAEHGVQRGAAEAAALTNVHISKLVEIRESTKSEVLAMQLRELYDRVDSCKQRYWDIPKDDRIAAGLRHEVGQFGYSGAATVGSRGPHQKSASWVISICIGGRASCVFSGGTQAVRVLGLTCQSIRPDD
jgi:restriction system protein